MSTGQLDDPLLKFTEESEHGLLTPYGETVSLSPLFSCQGAVDDALSRHSPFEHSLATKMTNANRLAKLLRRTDWELLSPQAAFRSGMVLCRATRRQFRQMPAEAIRSQFHHMGTALTTYNGGLLRIALPKTPCPVSDLTHLADSIATLNRTRICS